MATRLQVYPLWAILPTVLMVLQHNQVEAVNNRPVIGVLAHATAGSTQKYGDSLIYSDYVQFLHTGGARVVPIRINQTVDYYKKLFNSINGVLFPGGDVSVTTSGYAKAGKILFDLAIQANEIGDYFPVWGTCLGFQLLTVLVAKTNLLTATDAKNLPLPLELVTPDYKYSGIYGGASPELIDILQRENVTDNDHHYGVKPQAFVDNANLRHFFKVLSTNKDRKGNVFVSTMEGRVSPVWGVQFHPEQSYNWNPAFTWLHTNHAVQVTQHFANFFVDRARRSTHSYPDEKAALSAMIENYPRVYLKESDPFEAIYVLNSTDSNNID